MKRAFFPGSFNPFTKGHADIVERTLSFADEIIIGIGVNADKKDSEATAQKNVDQISSLYKSSALKDRVSVLSYSSLTAETAKKLGADFIVRGVRNSLDFEYENNLAVANKKLFGVETVLLPADPELSYVSSSMIRELNYFGASETASKFLVK